MSTQYPPEWGQVTILPGSLSESQLEPNDEAVYTIPVRNDYNASITALVPTVTVANNPPGIQITNVTVQYPVQGHGYGSSIMLPGTKAQIQATIVTTDAPPGDYLLAASVAFTILSNNPNPNPATGDEPFTVSPD